MNLSIRFPALPSSRLTVNYKRGHHWRTYTKDAADARLEAFLEAYRAYPSLGSHTPISARYKVTYGLPKGRRAQDSDNLAGWVKHHIDGIADHLSGSDDAGFVYTGAEIVPDQKHPGWFVIEITIE